MFAFILTATPQAQTFFIGVVGRSRRRGP